GGTEGGPGATHGGQPILQSERGAGAGGPAPPAGAGGAAAGAAAAGAPGGAGRAGGRARPPAPPPGPGPRRAGPRPAAPPGPGTRAALAGAGLRQGGLDSLLWLLSVQVIDKEDRACAALADRALVLARYVARRPRHGLAACNRGLYVEEAEALAPLLPAGAALWFVVGHDKIVQ